MPQDLIFENTGFNVNYWSPYTEDEFIEECLRDGIMKQYAGDTRVQVLKLVKQLINDAVGV